MALLIFHTLTLFTLNTQMIIDFAKLPEAGSWRVMDDVVMGGRSQGTFNITAEGFGEFKGEVSLENNGGFSSVRGRVNMLVEGHQQFVIRLKGDGKTYQLRVKKNAESYYSYTTAFATNGQWQTIQIPFNLMYPTFRGQTLDMPNYAGQQLQEIGFLIGNKKAEKFALLIANIQVQ